jgi:beta-alanine degradation protein BauB
MTMDTGKHHPALSRRQAVALLSAFGIGADALAQDAASTDPRAFRVVVDNPSVRVLEFKSRPGLGVCGQGMHYHPAHVTISLTGAKLKKTEGGKVSLVDIPPGHVFFAEAETHAAEIIGGSGTRTYIIELKGKDWKPSTG